MKTSLCLVFTLIISSWPFFIYAQVASSSDSSLIASLQAEVTLLTKELAALLAARQTEDTPTTPSTVSSCTIAHTLSQGARGPDVVCLQGFLISGSFLPQGYATGYYGALTQGAVERFQAAHSIVSEGSAATTGYGAMGPRTRVLIMSLLGAAVAVNTTPTPLPPATITPPITPPISGGSGFGGSGGGAGYSGGGGVAAPTCTMILVPITVVAGIPATLSWVSANASGAVIDNSIGDVAANGSTTIHPSANTTYIGTFNGAGGSVTCSTTLTVTPAEALAQLPGVLIPFYRTTTIQGPLIETTGSSIFLQSIPSYLTDASLDYPYHLKNASGLEVPFASTFTIVRALGGWTSNFVPTGKQPDSVDLYRYDSTTSQWVASYDQFISAIQPFLNAGYRPQDITIVLDNIPWDLSSNQCSDGKPVTGTYGNRSPIQSYTDWQNFITGFAHALNDATGGHAGDFTYRLGTEANGSPSFCGSLQDYEHGYAATVAALTKVIPYPKLMAYEFAATPGAGAGIFSTIDLQKWIVSNSLPLTGVGRSLNYFPSLKLRLPRSVASAGSQSFHQVYDANPALVSAAPAQIDQFGTISLNATSSAAFLDDGPSEASWNFQTMFQLVSQMPMRNVTHWQLFDTVPTFARSSFLLPTASSWLYQVLDNLLGTNASVLSTKVTPAQASVEPYAVAFSRSGRLTILASTYGMNIAQGKSQKMSIIIPTSMLPAQSGPYSIRTIPMSAQDTPSYLLRRALQNNEIPGAGLAKPFFNSTSTIIGKAEGVGGMAADTNGGNPTPSAVRKVGDVLVGSGPLAQAVRSQIKTMFTLQPYGSAYLTKNTDGSYTLDAGTFAPGDMKLFTIE